MNKSIPLLLLFMMLTMAAVSPLARAHTQLGIKAGVLNAWGEFSQDLPGKSLKSIIRPGGGLFLWLSLGSGRMGFQAEILYSTRGFDVREAYMDQEVSSVYTISYIEIPVMLSYRLFSHKRFQPVLLAGISIGLPTRVLEIQTVGGSTEERELGDNLKQTDAGFIIGFDLKYRMKRFFLLLAARYRAGLTNISRNIQAVSFDFYAGESIKNRSFSLMAGVALKLSP